MVVALIRDWCTSCFFIDNILKMNAGVILLNHLPAFMAAHNICTKLSIEGGAVVMAPLFYRPGGKTNPSMIVLSCPDSNRH